MKGERYNPPGKDRLDFRAGTYADFVRQMENLVKQPVLKDKDGDFPNPLKNLELHYRDDLAVALFKAWAVIGDILTFYQERIANEGYLQTAVERKSILELVDTIGYRLKPASPAATYLVFTAREKKAASKPLLVPKGTMVQGIPERGMQPVTFETVEDIEVRPQWNRIKLHIETQPGKHTVTQHTAAICFKGTAPGLKPGEYLLVTGPQPDKSEKEPVRYLRTIHRLEPVHDAEGKRLGTRVYLEKVPPSDSDPPMVALENPRVYYFRQQVPLFGHNAPEWHTVPLKTRQHAGTPRGGLFYSTDNGSNWNFAGKGLPQYQPRAVAIDSTGCIAVGTGKGVFCSMDKGETWQSTNAGLRKRDVYALHFDANDHLYVGSASGGAYRSTDRGQSWEPIQVGLVVEKEHHVKRHWKVLDTLVPNTTVRAIFSYIDPDDKDFYVFAGTDSGIMRCVNLEGIWEPAGEGLPGWNEDAGSAHVVVHCFIMHKKETHIFAGTNKGVFVSKNHGKSWHHLDEGLEEKEVFSLAACEIPDTHKFLFFNRKAKHYLFAGTRNGVFLSDNDGHSWHPVESLLAPGEGAPCVRSLVLSIDKKHIHLFAGTDKGVFLSGDLGETWGLEVTGFTNLEINALAVNNSGQLAAVAPYAGFLESQWPDFCIRGSQVDLVHAHTGIVPGSWMVLKQDKPRPLTRSCRVKSISHLVRRGFNRTGKVMRIETHGCTGLDSFDLRETQVFVQGEELELLEEQIPVTAAGPGHTIRLAGSIEGLKPGQAIAVTGQPASAGPENGSPAACEVRRIQGVQIPAGGKTTEVLLDKPLEHEYDPASVNFSFNVAYATQGETVSHEILGGGNAALANQTFTLKKQPLTYISAAGPGGAKSTLQVWVTSGPPHGYLKPLEPAESVEEKGILWQEVESLYNSGPLSRQYMVRVDEENNARVIFGDGDKGARLPTGIENVTATYRSGSGEKGNVAADRLVILKNRPLGVQKVTNPLPAIGGEAPETIDSARVKAPLSVRTLQRIVSISDYHDFTRSFAGIAKTSVKRLWDGKTHLVHITAAPYGGTVLQKDSSLYKNLLKALHTYRAVPTPLAVDSFEPVFFNIEANVTIEPGEDSGALENRIKNALQEAFSFKNRQLAREVGAAEIIVTVQQLKGVRAVDLQALYRTGTSISLTNALQADTAHWDPQDNNIHPAQLLIINTEKGGIILGMQEY